MLKAAFRRALEGLVPSLVLILILTSCDASDARPDIDLDDAATREWVLGTWDSYRARDKDSERKSRFEFVFHNVGTFQLIMIDAEGTTVRRQGKFAYDIESRELRMDFDDGEEVWECVVAYQDEGSMILEANPTTNPVVFICTRRSKEQHAE